MKVLSYVALKPETNLFCPLTTHSLPPLTFPLTPNTFGHIQLVLCAIISSIGKWNHQNHNTKEVFTNLEQIFHFPFRRLSQAEEEKAAAAEFTKFTLNLSCTKQKGSPTLSPETIKVCVWAQLLPTRSDSPTITPHPEALNSICPSPLNLHPTPSPALTFMLNCIFLQRPQTTAIAARQMGFMNARSQSHSLDRDPDLASQPGPRQALTESSC